MANRTTDGPGGLGWADVDACTLPTAERPLRLAEFDDLFASSLPSVSREGAERARLVLHGDGDLGCRTRRLAEAESSCCSFFTFGVREKRAGEVVLDIEVPAAQANVLAGLVARAEAAIGAAS